MRTLEEERPDLRDKLNVALAMQLLTRGNIENQPLTLPIDAHTYDEFQRWLWGTTLKTTTKWKGMILVRGPEISAWEEPLE